MAYLYPAACKSKTHWDGRNSTGDKKTLIRVRWVGHIQVDYPGVWVSTHLDKVHAAVAVHVDVLAEHLGNCDLILAHYLPAVPRTRRDSFWRKATTRNSRGKGSGAIEPRPVGENAECAVEISPAVAIDVN